MRYLSGILAFLIWPTIAFSQGVPKSPHFYNKVSVLCIGINDYQYVGDLSKAESDAKQFGEALREHYGYEPKYLLGRNATKTRINAAITGLGNRLGLDDSLIIYYSGHGVAFDRVRMVDGLPSPERVGFLVPHEADVQLSVPTDPRWDDEAIDMRTLVDSVKALKAHHVLIVADTCCSGFLTKRGIAEVAEQINLLKNPSRSVIAATTQREAAIEGIFTTQLLGILKKYAKNQDVACVSDLFDEVRGPVIAASQRKMTPQMSHVGDGDGEFILFPLSVRTESISAVKREVEEGRRQAKSVSLQIIGKGLLAGVVDRRNRRRGRVTRMAEVSAAISAPEYWFGSKAAEQTKHWQAMRERFHKNAAWGDPLAMVGLHFCYARGLGEEKKRPDEQAAYQWALAAKQIARPAGVGDYLLGRCYRHGLGVGKNAQTGRELYAKSAEAGFLLGRVADAQMKLFASPSESKAREAVKTLEVGMKAGLASSAIVIGDVHATGRYGLPQDPARAISYYEKAVQMGTTSPGALLYDAHTAGLPGYPPVNTAVAERYLREAANDGDGQAQFQLSVELLRDPTSTMRLNLKRSADEGVKWLELSAAQKFPRALVSLADYKSTGADAAIPINFDEAKTLIEAAVTKRDPIALVVQGEWYLGNGGLYPKNEQKALSCFRQSAALNDPGGCDMLGRCYQAGIGIEIPKAYQKAFAFHPKSHIGMHWYMKALEHGGDTHAEEELKKFRGLLNLAKFGFPYGQGLDLEPSDVLRNWKREFPKTETAFRKKFEL